jgi:hypothetical protein
LLLLRLCRWFSAGFRSVIFLNLYLGSACGSNVGFCLSSWLVFFRVYLITYMQMLLQLSLISLNALQYWTSYLASRNSGGSQMQLFFKSAGCWQRLSSSPAGRFAWMAHRSPQFRPILLCVWLFLHDYCGFLLLVFMRDMSKRPDFCGFHVSEYRSHMPCFGSWIMDDDLVSNENNFMLWFLYFILYFKYMRGLWPGIWLGLGPKLPG